MIRQKLKEQYRKLRFQLSASKNPFYIFFYRYLYIPKKRTLSHFAYHFSKQTKNLTVIQVGANDGFTHDPIHKFILAFDWKGVLIEPQPSVYKKLQHLHKKSKGITALHAAVDYSDGVKPIYKIAFSEARWATGLTSFVKSVIEKAIDSGYVASCAKRVGETLPTRREDFIGEDQITCMKPTSILEKFNLERVDWLQIDTEGFDFEVIKMFEIGKTKPKVIVFEHSHLTANEKEECYAYLQKHTYQLSPDGGNTLAVLEPDDNLMTLASFQ